MMACRILLTFAVLVNAAWGSPSPLEFMARTALEENILTLSSGQYLRAGAHHFGSLWTRDFCYSVPGLLRTGHAQVVRDHLTRLLQAMHPQTHLVPRSLDHMNTVHRVILQNLHIQSPPPREPLKAEYKGEHNTIAIDSNLLVLRAAWAYVQASGDRAWWQEHREQLQNLYDFYRQFTRDGLIVQVPFSDWQDSVRREGATFLTNFLHWQLSEQLALHNSGLVVLSTQERTQWRQRLWQLFYVPEQGLFRSLEGSDVISLDGNLWALMEDNFWRDGAAQNHSYQRLRSHPLWWHFGLPGMASYPNYPARQISWTTKLVGLRHYHDQMLWPWLSGLALATAEHMGDSHEAGRIHERLQDLVLEHGGLDEIMGFDRQGQLVPFRRGFYRSEKPFSWSAAMIAWALSRP